MQIYEEPQKTQQNINECLLGDCVFPCSKHAMTLECNSPWIRKTSYAILYLSVDGQPCRPYTNDVPNNLSNKPAT